MKDKIVVSICTGTGGVAAGGLKVLERFQELLDEKAISAEIRPRAHKVGCRGFCAKDVLVDVTVNGGKHTYQQVTRGMVPKIVDDHIINGRPVDEWLVGDDYEAFHGAQQKLVLANCGLVDPESIDDYIDHGGYRAVKKALDMTPEAVIDIVKQSGLRGRGGAGFPTGIKWESLRRARADTCYLICNADEGDPGAFMDRSVIEGNPHAIIEGLLIGAWATGSNKAHVYIRAEYPLAVERLKMALVQAGERFFLGENILGRGFKFDIHVFLGAGAFVCGEETALIASIEDKPGEPKLKYVFPTEKGLWDKPTAINNVETWANVPLIIDRGPEWFNGIGSESSKGTKIFSLVGKINNTGLVEVPMGIPLKTIIYDIGGGIPDGKKFKAVQTGGPSGGCITEEFIDLPVDYESIAKVGSIMGSGGMIVMDEDTCMVDMARFFISFCAEESCGQCTPCREGVKLMENILTEITEGRGEESHIQQLEDLAEVVFETSLCGLGKTAPNPVRSTLRYFKDEYLAHIRDKHCPAGVCKRLVPVDCQMACPAGIDVPGYIANIAHGRFREAVETIRHENPFPWVCGLVCPAPCELSCRRGSVDTPIAIRQLKGFAGKYVMEETDAYPVAIQSRRNENVAVIGSGPAGLSAAYYLALAGYAVTVFEALPQPGGMLRVGIPDHRLPQEILDREIRSIINMGVKIKTDTPLGPDLTIDDLFKQGFNSVFLGIGAHKPLNLGLADEDAVGVLQGVTYLRQLNLNQPVPEAGKVVVIGGGNVAIDVARAAIRKGTEQVTILYRRTRREMPAYDIEIREALEEGITIKFLTAPKTVIVENGRVTGLECLKMKLGKPDDSGRRRPVPVEGTEFMVMADLVCPAIGQRPDIGPLENGNDLKFSKWHTIEVNEPAFNTDREGVFAAGDAVSGPATVIEAIAGGREAARAIDAYLKGDPLPARPRPPRRRTTVAPLEINPEKLEQLERARMPLLNLEQRKTTFKQVELGFRLKTARDEAKRCLRCDLAE